MPETFDIDGVIIKPGERKRLEIKVAKLFDHTDISIPIEVIRGKENGPCMFISAAIHGDEINGVGVVRRVLSRKKLLKNLRGTLIAIPIVNMFGFNRNTRYLPDRRDLNRTFPGSKNGSLTAQIAYKFMTEIVEKCQYGIDLHTGSAHRYNLPQIRALLDDNEIKEMAYSFGVPVVINSNVRDGSLRQAATEIGVKVLIFEGGEALRYDEKIIRSAENGIISVMCKIGMLELDQKNNSLLKKKEVFLATSNHWVRAPSGGSLHIRKNIGKKVRKDQILGVISDPFGIKKEYVRARKTGVIVGITMLPLVNNGDALFHIATFENAHEVASEVEKYHEELDVDWE